MLALLLVCLFCIQWQESEGLEGLGTFQFSTKATGPLSVCEGASANFYCTVIFEINNGGDVLIRDAVWKRNGIIIPQSGHPRFTFIRNSKSPSHIIGVTVKNVQKTDNWTIYTCTDGLAPDKFATNAILNVTDTGCNKKQHQTTGIVLGVLLPIVIVIIVVIISIFLYKKLLKRKSRCRQYRILDDSVFSATNYVYSPRTESVNEAVDANSGTLPDDRPLVNGPSNATSTASEDNHQDQQPEEIVIDSDDMDHSYHTCDKRLLEQVWEVCNSKFSRKQIISTLELNDQDANDAVEFLMSGPSLQKILIRLFAKSQNYPVKIIKVNQTTQCSDLIDFYKNPDVDFSNSNIVIHLQNVPTVDAGGVRRQMYTRTLKQLSANQHYRLFQGKNYHIRPYYSASATDTEMFKVLGCIVGHSIIQEGIGFPYLSPLCYWYIAADKNTAMLHYTDDDVGAACNFLITNLNKAKTVDDVAVACNAEEAQDLLEAAKVNMQVKLDNKDQVIQLLKVHEALFSIKILLDQFKVGLRKVKMLDLIQSFPNVFAPMFIFTGEISANEVVRALCVGSDNEDPIAMEFLKQYISSLSQEDLQSFMICITGTTCIQDQNIMVNFSNDLEQIKISTCSRELFLPFGVCKREEYEKFKAIMDVATIGDYRYNSA